MSSPRLGRFVLPQPGITGRYLQQECGSAASVRADIPLPFKCAAAAVQLSSHPLLSHPQTHPVGVRTCYHTPFLSPPLIYHTPKHTLWVFGRPFTPSGLSHPPWAHCELHFITRGVHKISHPPQDTAPGDHIFKSQNVISGVCHLVPVTVKTHYSTAAVPFLSKDFWSKFPVYLSRA